ncbi:hypothetical protein BDY21DRAFT_341430 [Lineolata rhizophorae]|uniref:Uncharacterized protein n=1 Tax=Lineolata rhizophorae TaxID=578093 RepID=A0A6A6P4A6_9PEZI|nr:hypothetical protein BDY21DRAFT_341430 [Lineolata rhizophorae]
MSCHRSTCAALGFDWALLLRRHPIVGNYCLFSKATLWPICASRELAWDSRHAERVAGQSPSSLPGRMRIRLSKEENKRGHLPGTMAASLAWSCRILRFMSRDCQSLATNSILDVEIPKTVRPLATPFRCSKDQAPHKAECTSRNTYSPQNSDARIRGRLFLCDEIVGRVGSLRGSLKLDIFDHLPPL